MTTMPESSAAADEATQSKIAVRGFRWRIIPATLSWFMGGALIAAAPVSLVALIITLVESNWRPDWYIWPLVASSPFLAVNAVLFVWAGFRWRDGRWISAILMNAIGSAAGAMPQAIMNAAIAARLDS